MPALKMARASEESFNDFLEFLQELDERIKQGERPFEIGEWAKKRFPNINWKLIVWGYHTLAANAADPNLKHLDWRPEIKAAIDAYEAREEGCEWSNDGEYWATCNEGLPFCFSEGGPSENGFKFCPFCGRKLVIKMPKINLTAYQSGIVAKLQSGFHIIVVAHISKKRLVYHLSAGMGKLIMNDDPINSRTISLLEQKGVIVSGMRGGQPFCELSAEWSKSEAQAMEGKQ